MKNKQYETRTEKIEFDSIKELYEMMLSANCSNENSRILIEKLLTKQKADGSWSVIERTMCDSDMRVDYIYFPTYYATAALMFADLKVNFPEGSAEREALLKGLNFARGRELMGHGFDAMRQMLDALIIYKNAGLYCWISEKRNVENAFCHLIHRKIAQMRVDIKNGNTVFDWSVDFKKDYEREIRDYDNVESPYVWYACYGSNINKNRFMNYICNCTDKTPPAEDRPFSFKHNIYFAKSAGRWYNGGKAFLDDTVPGKALGRVYKIKKAQFEEIKVSEGADYTKLLYLGDIQDIPVYTFTDVQKSVSANVPSDEYYKTILEGLKDCYGGIIEERELDEYLISSIFPEYTFAVAKVIKENDHYITNAEISSLTGLSSDVSKRAVMWLLEHRVIKQDSRSTRSGHRITDEQACFYTVDGHCGRGLLATILEHLPEAENICNEELTEFVTVGNTEGARRFVYASRIERNYQNRIDAIRMHGYKCQVCGFDFVETYGELGRNYIEVHHVNPLAEQDGEHIVNPAVDLVCLCANCHRMMHRNRNQVLSIDQLRDVLNENRKEHQNA